MNAIRLIWKRLRRWTDNQPDAVVLLATWLVLAAVGVSFGFVTCQYYTADFWDNVLVELHGSLIDLAAIGVVAAMLIARRTKKEYLPVVQELRARLLELAQSTWDQAHGYATDVQMRYHMFGDASAWAMQDFSALYSLVASRLVRDEVELLELELKVSANEPARDVVKAKVRGILDGARTRLSFIADRADRVITRLEGLPAATAESAVLLKKVHTYERSLERALAAASLRISEDSAVVEWKNFRVCEHRLLSATIELAQHLIGAADEALTSDELKARIEAGTAMV